MFRTLRGALYTQGLIGTVAAALIAVAALLSFQALDDSAGRAMRDDDLVADALPPSLLQVEMRLLASRAAEGRVAPQQAAQQLDQLHLAFEQRVDYWMNHSDAPTRALLRDRLVPSERRLVEVTRRAVLVPLRADDPVAAIRGLDEVDVDFGVHREAARATAAQAKVAAQQALSEFTTIRRAGLPLLGAAGAALLCVVAWGYFNSLRSILTPLGECVAIAERVAEGDLREVPVSSRVDELGQLLGALRAMTASLGRQRAELTRAREAAEAGARAKAQFLANMSHEIRTPMNAVLGLAHLLLQTGVSPRQRNYLEKIESAGKSLLRIINDILDLSKVEADKLVLVEAPFNVDRMLRETVDAVCAAVDGKPVEVIVRRDESVPAYLLGDEGRLRQVLLNLVGNAAKFTARGEIRIDVTAAALPAADSPLQSIAFSVTDTGIGMSEEVVGRLFEPFSQGDDSRARHYGGTGLGLAISLRLVRLMGGELGVHSEPGRGSSFAFTLPLGRVDPASNAEARHFDERIASARLLLRGRRALVVDDNFTARVTLAALLRSFGMEVVEVDGGPRALAIAEDSRRADSRFAVALIDWRMPEVDGFAVIDAMRRAPAMAQTAFIMVSAGEQEDVEAAIGMTVPDGLLQKPVTPSSLLDALHTALARTGEPAGRVAPRHGDRPSWPTLAGDVLLVEDNEINQLVGKELLKAMGLRVTVADDGAQALEQVKRRRFDLIALDLEMPRMDGYQAAREIRKTDGSANVPIIAMTANSLEGEREQCLAAGMNDYLSKPIDPGVLAQCLERWLPGTRRS